MKEGPLPHRREMTEVRREAWRPPLFRSPTTTWTRAMAAVRRGMDLQASSIWADLTKLLGSARGSILDVGCGAQPYRELAPRGVSYRGIDTVDAHVRFGYKVPDTTYFAGGAWPCTDSSAATILVTETLEHVLDLSQFLAEARRCLAPGGRLILTVPFSARWHFIPHDYWRFTPSGLQHLLANAGLPDVAVYARGDELTVACYKIATLILGWLLQPPSWSARDLTRRVAAAACLPLLLVAIAVGQASLWASEGGEDCLGYTVVARRPIDTEGTAVSGIEGL